MSLLPPFLDLVGTKERVRGHGLKIVLPTRLRTQRWSHQFPLARPLCQEPPICFSAVRLSISSNVLPLKSANAAFHVPETVLPSIRAVHVPRQPSANFRADQVPSRTIWSFSLRSVQEPRAIFLLGGRTWADHLPWKVRFDPAVAIQLPRSTGGACWATA